MEKDEKGKLEKGQKKWKEVKTKKPTYRNGKQSEIKKWGSKKEMVR